MPPKKKNTTTPASAAYRCPAPATPIPFSTTKVKLFPDYHQFNIQDSESKSDLGKAWTKETVARRCAVNDGLVGVGTMQDMNTTNVHVEVFHSPQPLVASTAVMELGAADRIVRVIDAPLSAPSAKVVVAGCTEYWPDCPRIALPAPGLYRCRLYMYEWRPGDEIDEEEQYRVQLWRDDKIKEVSVLTGKGGGGGGDGTDEINTPKEAAKKPPVKTTGPATKQKKSAARKTAVSTRTAPAKKVTKKAVPKKQAASKKKAAPKKQAAAKKKAAPKKQAAAKKKAAPKKLAATRTAK